MGYGTETDNWPCRTVSQPPNARSLSINAKALGLYGALQVNPEHSHTKPSEQQQAIDVVMRQVTYDPSNVSNAASDVMITPDLLNNSAQFQTHIQGKMAGTENTLGIPFELQAGRLKMKGVMQNVVQTHSIQDAITAENKDTLMQTMRIELLTLYEQLENYQAYMSELIESKPEAAIAEKEESELEQDPDDNDDLLEQQRLEEEARRRQVNQEFDQRINQLSEWLLNKLQVKHGLTSRQIDDLRPQIQAAVRAETLQQISNEEHLDTTKIIQSGLSQWEQSEVKQQIDANKPTPPQSSAKEHDSDNPDQKGKKAEETSERQNDFFKDPNLTTLVKALQDWVSGNSNDVSALNQDTIIEEKARADELTSSGDKSAPEQDRTEDFKAFQNTKQNTNTNTPRPKPKPL